MAEGLNRVMLFGNLGADPELRVTPGGQAILKLRLATNESYLDKNNVRQERTEWHRVTIWGRRAEALGKILTKGDSLFIEGRLSTSSYEKNGEKRYSTEIVANNVVLPGRGRGDGAGAGAPRGEGGGAPRREAPRGGGGGGGGGEMPSEAPFDDFAQGAGSSGGGDDDIPF
jgi:single-strand DNA-binding protein